MPNESVTGVRPGARRRRSLPRHARPGVSARVARGAALSALGVALGLGLPACAPGAGTSAAPSASLTRADPPGLDAIREADLRRDLFAMSGDAMRGREAGTLDEMRATAWVAEQARAAGLEPAGEDGTYFQWWPMRRTRVSDGSRVAVGDRPLSLWTEVVAASLVPASIDLPLVFVGDADSAALARMDLRGKAVAATVGPLANPPGANVSLREWRYALGAVRGRATQLTRTGAAAVLLVSGEVPELAAGFPFAAAYFQRGQYGIDSAGAPAGPYAAPPRGRGAAISSAAAASPRAVPVLWVRHELLDDARAPGARLTASLEVESYTYPSANVVARVRGSDPAKANEYLLYSAHQDHDGVRYPVNGDSIWNGADDNATVSVALLAAGRAFARHPAPRPVLFVWHGAEERGLLGSRWFVSHPLVPLSSIVAVLNGDMIGRNDPDSAALLGAQPPHRNSVALVEAALQANDQITHFKLDTIWDRESHPEGWYYRSDHLPYARMGVPAIMFSTLLHPDYHTPRDEPQRIDVAKLARMTRWMYATGWIVANAPRRPDAVPGFVLPR